jgi:diphosphomevalonate decarboxylase
MIRLDASAPGPGRATALAHPNIALSKYWGKLPGGGNRPAVPSLSLTLDGLATRTTVRFDVELAADRLTLDGRLSEGRALERVSGLLDAVHPEPRRPRAEVTSDNDFPTAAGLASSASAFAALVVAAAAAAGADASREQLSDWARRASASAARSLYEGFVELPAGAPELGDEELLAARVVAPRSHWDVRLLVAVTSTAPKEVGSSLGMVHTARTSPLYAAWVEAAPAIHAQVKAAVLARDLALLGEAMEHSALTMHAVALAARPAVSYWNPATLEVMAAVRALRAAGLAAYVTIDAGPHVKVLVPAAQAAEIEQRLAAVPGVVRTLRAAPGAGARLVTTPDEPPR